MTKLIYDVGMYDGADTEFYLRKGFSVVAIDANPVMANWARQRFAADIEAGRLVIYNVALTAERGDVSFFVHQHGDWSRLDRSVDDRFPVGTYREVQVAGVQFEDLYRRHQPPHYVKLDIEGGELLALQQMFSCDGLPGFISFEVNRDTGAMLELLLSRGYDRFSLLPQGDKSWIRMPYPPLEGLYVDCAFNGLMSGPFGEEVPLPWVDHSELVELLERAQRHRVSNGRETYAEWYDIHARRRIA